jgi:isocitrate dehydrogenase (NAD+)
MILSAKMMLEHIDEKQAAIRLEKAIANVIAQGKKLTYDLKTDRSESAATTSEVADAIIDKLKI